jgi:hypothetical protein
MLDTEGSAEGGEAETPGEAEGDDEPGDGDDEPRP